MTEEPDEPSARDGAVPRPVLDASVAHFTRVYNYWLGGKDNFEADRVAGQEAIDAFPAIRWSARANRAFLVRTVSYLAGQRGIRQFLDIGAGLPAAPNTHQVAQSIAPTSRIVYVDNDRCKSGCTHVRASSVTVHRESVTILVVKEPLR
jgi:S-adenosyl methyltransferase